MNGAQTGNGIVTQFPLQALTVGEFKEISIELSPFRCAAPCHSGLFPVSLVDQVLKAVGASVKTKGIILNLAIDVSLVRQPDVSQTVACHVATVTILALEGLEVISVKTAQAVPGRKPHESVSILQQLCDMVRWHTVLFIIFHLMILRLRHTDRRSDEEHKDNY